MAIAADVPGPRGWPSAMAERLMVRPRVCVGDCFERPFWCAVFRQTPKIQAWLGKRFWPPGFSSSPLPIWAPRSSLGPWSKPPLTPCSACSACCSYRVGSTIRTPEPTLLWHPLSAAGYRNPKVYAANVTSNAPCRVAHEADGCEHSPNGSAGAGSAFTERLGDVFAAYDECQARIPSPRWRLRRSRPACPKRSVRWMRFGLPAGGSYRWK